MFKFRSLLSHSLKVWAGVQQTFLGRRLRRPTATALPRVSRVTRLNCPLAPLQRPVTPQARQQAGKHAEAGPARVPPFRSATARIVRTRFTTIPFRTVVEQALDAAQAGGVVDDGVRRQQAVVAADPPLRQRPRLLAGVAPAPLAFRAQDGRPRRALGGVLAEGRRRRLLGDRRRGRRQQGQPGRPLHPRRLRGRRRRWRPSERGLDVLIGGAFRLRPGGDKGYRRRRT